MEKSSNDVINFAEEIFRISIDYKLESDVGIILAHPILFGKAGNTGGTVSGRALTSCTRRRALEALSLRVTI